MENAKKYLEDCVYFEIEDGEVTNYFMRIGKRWIRGDDGLSFSEEGVEQFVDQLLRVTRPLKLTFYGRKIEKVSVNG